MQSHKLHYFDSNATTRVAPEVLEAMLPFLSEQWGNPSSAYALGRNAAVHLREARARCAALIGADADEIVFTSGGTESINAAIHHALASRPGRRHIVTSAVEHSATLRCCQRLERSGHPATFLPVESDGSLDLHRLDQSIRPDTALVTLLWANNETGVLFPVEEIAAICRGKGVWFHADAVQVPGKVSIDVRALGVDLLSLSGHKFHAPKGIGMLYIRRPARFEPFVVGGHQEQGRRGGTENVAGIVGMGRAAELAVSQLREEQRKVRGLRDRLEAGILKIPGTTRNGSRDLRVSNTSNIAFEGLEAEAILLMLDRAGICASSGSACTTGSIEPSHVLTAMGLSPARARSSVRFSLDRYNSERDVDYLLAQLPAIIRHLRGEGGD